MPWVTQIKLKNGESLTIPIEKGNKVRKAKIDGTGSIFLEDHGNRVLDVVMIGDIQDVFQRETLEPFTTNLLKQPEIKDFDPNAEGYQKFLKAREKLNKKLDD